MIKYIKKMSILALILLFIGGLCFTVAFAASEFNFSKLSGVKLVEKKESFGLDTEKLIINLESTDVRFEFSGSATELSVKYSEKQNKNNDTLTDLVITKSGNAIAIREKVYFKSYVNFWDHTDTEITVTIPEALKIELIASTDTGDITLTGNASFTSASFETETGDINTERAVINADSRLDFEVDTGDVELGKFNTATLYIEANSGDVSLKSGTASDKINIETDSGEIEFDGTVNTQSLIVEVDTGDVECEKDAVIKANSTAIKSSSGNVSLRLSGNNADYKTTVRTGSGSSNIKDNLSGSKTLNIKTGSGDVRISFTENN